MAAAGNELAGGTGQALTARALLIGLAAVVFINVADPYSENILGSSLLGCDYLPLGVMLPFLVVVVFLVPVLKVLGRRFALSREELTVIFIMGLVGTTIPTFGLTEYLISIISSPFYFASPENHWAEFFGEHLPAWATPQNPEAVRWFYEGLPEGQAIPWGVWVIPLFWWLSFIAVVFFASLCIIVMLRRQWMDNERLTYPLAQVPLLMTEGLEAPSPWPAFLHQRMFWVGAVIPMVLVAWEMANWFYPAIPSLRTFEGRYLPTARDFPPIRFQLYFPLIGFTYLINLDVSFSIWFFYVLGIIQVGILNRFGLGIGEGDIYTSEGDASLGWLSFGGFVVMVWLGLWMARGHLGRVARKAFGRAAEVDDSQELLGYRTALWGFVVAVIYMAFWLHQLGMTWAVILLFLFAAFTLYIGITRMVVEGGLVFLRGPMIPQTFSIRLLGSTNIPSGTMTALALSYAWFCDVKAFFMPAVAHATKLLEIVRIHRKAVLTAVVLAVVVGVAVSVTFVLHMGYTYGAHHRGFWIFAGGAEVPYDNVLSKMQNPFGPDWTRLKLLVIGGGIMFALMAARFRFPWWPIHPIGYAVSFTWPIWMSASSIFLGWLCKFIVLRMGGIKLFNALKPTFLGLILGHFFACGVGFVVDLIWFPEQGHQLYGW
jgi:hypothetical protein